MKRGVNDDGGRISESDAATPAKDDRKLALSRPDAVVRSSRALGAENGRPVVVVLGMHRSGTSLLSNILHYLGVDMADMTDHTGPKNAGGFWERPELTAIHDEILEAIGRPIGRVSHVLPFPPAWWRRKEVQALKPKLIGYVERELAKSGNPWGFKDPRTCRLLPLWWEVFRELNLRPIYVHAVRNPAEASVSMSQKSSARKMSVANGELMWLTYNYDVVRYVTAEHPTVMVDYSEWFVDGTAVARRLVSELEIGDDLTSDDIAECVSSILNRELRHQVDGMNGVVSKIPMAAMLYDAMIASDPLTSADALALRRQLRLVDLFLKSLASIANELDAATAAQVTLIEEQRALIEHHGVAEQAAADELASAQQSLGESEATAQRLEVDQQAIAVKLASARSAFEEAKTLAEKAKEVAEREVTERTDLTDQLAAMERDTAVTSEQLTLAAARGTQLETQLLAAREELREMLDANSQQLANVELKFKDTTAQVQRSQIDLEALRAELAERDSSAGESLALIEVLRAELAERDSSAGESLALIEVLRAELSERDISAGESLALIEALRAELADRDTDAAELLAEMQGVQAQVADGRQHRSLLDARNRRLAEQLIDRNQEIAALGDRDRNRATDADTPETGFGWPVDATDYEIEGRVSTVGTGGIQGEIRFARRPDVTPIVEIRVGGALALAQACSADAVDGELPEAGTWQFAIPWSRFGQGFAGQQAVVRVAGFELEIGRADIPGDLHRYHMAPALIAAQCVGGTVAEAEEYHRWIARHEPASDLSLARSYRHSARVSWPRIIVIIYGADPNRAEFCDTLASLRPQVHTQWEALCVGAPDEIAEFDRRARAVAPHALHGEWASYPDDALISFIEAGDRLAPTALLHLAVAALASPDFALIYSDEDRIDPGTGTRAMPYMKGEWSVDLALAQDYVSRLALLRRKRALDTDLFDAAKVREMVLRAALAEDGAIVHLPFVLYHRVAEKAEFDTGHAAVVAQVLSESPPAAAGASLVDTGGGRMRTAWPLPDPVPRVSLIVPTRDRVDLLRVSVDGFLNDTRYDDLEILIADNDSVEEDALAYLTKIAGHPRVRVIPCPGPFNYSAINNLAATHATGSLIGLMNNDLKVIDPDWLRLMVSHAVRPDVGIVGAKLLHGDDTIQHAGVTLGIATASHLYKLFPPDAAGHNDRLLLPQDLSAVTAACLLIRRDVWDKVGGLNEGFPVAYNDIDLCLKVRDAGYRVVWTPDVLLYHLESQSRGTDLTPEKRERLDQDKARLMERWGERLLSDPFHSPNLSDRHVDARLAFPPRVSPPWRQEALALADRGRRA